MPKGVPNKRYTPEFKQRVVEAVVKEGLGYKEAARIYEIDGHDRIQSWERIYLEEGPEGLAVERRGARQQGTAAKAASKRGRRRSAGGSPAASCGGRLYLVFRAKAHTGAYTPKHMASLLPLRGVFHSSLSHLDKEQPEEADARLWRVSASSGAAAPRGCAASFIGLCNAPPAF